MICTFGTIHSENVNHSLKRPLQIFSQRRYKDLEFKLVKNIEPLMFNVKKGGLLKVVFAVAMGNCVIACSPSRDQGAYLYERECSSCHMPDGSGLGALYPPLADSDYLRNNQEKLACIIKYGITDTLTVNGIQYELPMEGIKKLNEVEITNIINYLNTAWNNQIAEQRLEDISLQLKKCN